MVVQYILAVRKGRREVKSDSNIGENKENKNEDKLEREQSSNFGQQDIKHNSDITDSNSVAMKDLRIYSECKNTESNVEKSEVPISIYNFSEDIEQPVLRNNLSLKSERYDSASKIDQRVKETEKIQSDTVTPVLNAMEAPSKERLEMKSKHDSSSNKADVKYMEVEEYFVKYRNFSYLHCEWKTEDELFKGDKRISAKLKRFKQKMAHHANIFENVSVIYCVAKKVWFAYELNIFNW